MSYKEKDMHEYEKYWEFKVKPLDKTQNPRLLLI
jgi:hypothetical protein